MFSLLCFNVNSFSVQFSSAQLIPPYINTVSNSPSRLASASTHLIPSSHPVKTQTSRMNEYRILDVTTVNMIRYACIWVVLMKSPETE